MADGTIQPNDGSDERKIVLFAISDEPVRKLITARLPFEAFPYHYHVVATLPEAHQWLAQNMPTCVVLTVDIALGSDNTPGLIAVLPRSCATISLIQRRRDLPTYPDYLYVQGAFNDWCTMPFSMDELLARIQQNIFRSQQGNKPVT
jgi:DNA-binding response OmpR family regulator